MEFYTKEHVQSLKDCIKVQQEMLKAYENDCKFMDAQIDKIIDRYENWIVDLKDWLKASAERL